MVPLYAAINAKIRENRAKHDETVRNKRKRLEDRADTEGRGEAGARGPGVGGPGRGAEAGGGRGRAAGRGGSAAAGARGSRVGGPMRGAEAAGGRRRGAGAGGGAAVDARGLGEAAASERGGGAATGGRRRGTGARGRGAEEEEEEEVQEEEQGEGEVHVAAGAEPTGALQGLDHDKLLESPKVRCDAYCAVHRTIPPELLRVSFCMCAMTVADLLGARFTSFWSTSTNRWPGTARGSI